MATDIAAAKTPSPSPGIRTPPAPRLGAYLDSYEPYPSRKSARISSQRAADRTPSPQSSHRRQLASPRTTKKANTQSDAAIASPAASPRKRRQPPPESSRRVSGALTVESTASASAALGLGDKAVQKPANTSVSRAAGMLPTPSKTPQKAPNEKTAADIQSFARNLFPSEDAVALSTPRKKRAKKYSGMTMESFAADEAEEPIEIFTDSQDRVPEKDNSSANPFFGDVAAAPEPAKRRSTRRRVMIPGEGAQSIDEASRREDGMVYVFRGKKFFRKFANNEDEESDERDASAADDDLQHSRPLSRAAAVKPRLLFPTDKAEDLLDDEEAATDVEDSHMRDGEAEPQTPVKPHHKLSKTPEAPKFAPVSPPDTKRTTRATNKLDEGTPMKSTGRRSLFDSWPRTKEHREQSAAKRQGDDLSSAQSKRTRT